MRKIRKRE
jgi:hypothetical protein